MRAQARAVTEQVVRPNLVDPAADSTPAHTPELVQAIRRNAPLHFRDPEVPGRSLCGWRYSQSTAFRLITDPL
eukprot:13691568-Alexandrium_andersonii.AAC.1